MVGQQGAKVASKGSESWLNRLQNKDWKLYAGVIGAVALAALGVGAIYYSTRPSNRGDKKKPKKGSKGSSDSSEIQPLLEEISPKEVSESDSKLQGYFSMSAVDIAKLINDEREEISKRLKEEGNEKFRRSDYNEAIRCYSKGIEFKPHAVLYCNRAACQANLRNYNETIEDCNLALALNKQYLKAYLRRGQAYEKLSRQREALDDYTAAHILSESRNNVASSSVERVLTNIASAEAREVFKNKVFEFPTKSVIEAFMAPFEFEIIEESDRSSSGDDAYIKANNFMVSKKYQDAYKSVEIALKEGTTFECDALLLRALFRVILRKTEEALEDADKALGFRPLEPIPYIIRATHLVEQNQINEALECLNEAKGMNPDSFEVSYHQAQLQFMMGDFVAAVESYKECIKLRPNSVLSYVQLGVAQFKMNDSKAADLTYRNLIKEFPKSPEAHNYYAELLMAMDRNEEALARLDEALKCDSTFILASVNLAILNLQYTKDFARAEVYCLKALEGDPESDVANATLAQIYLVQNKNKEAAVAFQRCIEYARTEKEVEAAASYKEAALAQIRFYEAHPEIAQVSDLISS